MKRIIIVLAIISLTGSVAFAQKVRSDNSDIRFAAGVRIPLEHSWEEGGEVLSLTYGKYNSKGFGFRGGVQWMFENMGVDDYLGIPLSVSWSSGRKHTFKQSLESGVDNVAYSIYHNKYYYGDNPNTGSIAGSFLFGLLSGFEVFAGLTPGYIFGPQKTARGSGVSEHYSYIKNRFSLSADAGFGLSCRIWRFRLSFIPSFHYFITDNYREVEIDRYTHDGSTDVHTSDKAKSWQVSFQGGLSFSF